VEYVSLHHHSTFSYGDGYGLPKEHVERCAFLGMKAMALTEHGNTSSHVQLEKSAKAAGIKPIYGVEGYIAEEGEQRKFHQTILAMDQTGFANLNGLVSQSWRDFYRWPTVHKDNLVEHADGLIIISGCADSELSCTLLGGKSLGDKHDDYINAADYKDAIRLVQWYQTIFGDRYYLECQRFPGLERSRALNSTLEHLSVDTGAPLVATSDCHYVYSRDAEMQKILHASHRGSTVDAVSAAWEYSITLDIPASDEQVYDDLKGTGLSDDAAEQALFNTGVIADRTNVELPKVKPLAYPIGEGDYKPWI
jgi:DNA polymerase III subunit alpha